MAEEPPPNCLATGNNGAIVGGGSAGRRLAHTTGRTSPKACLPACHTRLSPLGTARGRHIFHPGLACLARALGTSSTWMAI